MTRPSTRASHQTNSFEGGFVRKVPFLLLFFLINFPLIFFLTGFLYYSFLERAHCQLEGPNYYTREIGSLFMLSLYSK